MLSRIHISVFVVVAAATWWAVLYFNGTPIAAGFVAPFSTVVTVMVAISVLFEHTLWRLPLLHGWFVDRPYLRGTWRVEIRSDWINPSTNEPVGVISGFMGVQQTFSRIRLHLMTEESESWSEVDGIQPATSGKGYQLGAIYTNRPQMPFRQTRSPMHRGALALETHGDPSRPDRLTGEYWTDRKTVGQLALGTRIDPIATSFVEARALFLRNG